MDATPEILKTQLTNKYHSQKVWELATGEAFTVFYVYCELESDGRLKVKALLERMNKSDITKRAVLIITAAELQSNFKLQYEQNEP